MNEIKETKELKYTQEDILNTLLALDEETRDYVVMFELDKLLVIANDENTQDSLYANCDAYQKLKESIKTFVSMLDEQKEKGTECTIDEMIKNYKGFSREEKLEFYKRFSDATSIESSVDNFKYTWNKFMKTLSGVTN